LAAIDFVDGLRLIWLWSALAQQDIKLRYRGSVIGPFWQTLTTAAMVGSLGLLYPRLFKVSVADYLPMVAVGLVFWTFVTGMVTEGCKAFTEVQHILHVVKLPFSVHVYRVVYRNVLTLAHNFVIIPIVLLIFPPPIGILELLAIVPAFLIVVLNGVWISLLFGMISARYRDIPPIIASIIQLLLFVTPIFWQYQLLGPDGWWAQLNPLFVAVDVMRAPLLGQPTASFSWPIMMLLTIAGCGGTFAFFARFRSRLPFWV
jgi:ABC-2 type transport system permease protein/lipopolysaccharide transport system permease protein